VSAERTVEVEAKFQVPDAETLARLGEASALAGYDVAPGVARRDVDVYLDTAGRRVFAAGWYLRRRSCDCGLRFTLKQIATATAGVLCREELEELLPAAAVSGEAVASGGRASGDVAATVPPDDFLAELPAGTLRERVERLVGDEPLQPLLELSQVRVARVVRRGEDEVAELSLDQVTVAGRAEEPGWLEAEVEARGSGSDEDVAALAAALRDDWCLAPEGRAKFVRALELVDDGVSPAVTESVSVATESMPVATSAPLAKSCAAVATETRPAAAVAETSPTAAAAEAHPVGAAAGSRPLITAADTMTAAAAAILRCHFERLLRHEEGTYRGEDSEELHDMRVATRRMRMALRVFASDLDPTLMRPLLKGLRRSGRTLGAVRDLDVFTAKARRFVESLPTARAAELDGLLAAAAAERRRCQQELLEYLDGDKYRRFVTRTSELLAGSPERLAPRGPVTSRPRSVAKALPSILHERFAAVAACEAKLDGLATPLSQFHALRKACRGLRYTLEFFEDALGPEARPLIERLEGLQDHLGALQDAVVGGAGVCAYLAQGTWRPAAGVDKGEAADEGLSAPPQAIVDSGAARYLLACQEEMERLIIGFPEAWTTAAGHELRADLAVSIARLGNDRPLGSD